LTLHNQIIHPTLVTKLTRRVQRGPRNVLSITLSDEGDNHPVEIVEKRKEIETKLDKALPLVRRQRPENLCGIIHMRFILNFMCVEYNKWRVEEECHPLTREKEQ